MRPLIVGQAPSRASDPAEALSGKSGRRLAALCGIPFEAFLAGFERSNLLADWPGEAQGKGDRFVGLPVARALAERYRRASYRRRVVVLGFKTAAAFGLTGPALAFFPHWEGWFAFCPHPSGVSTWWNVRANEERARKFWTALARSIRL